MPIVDISALPAAPSRRQSPADFVAAADAHVAALTPMVAQLNAAFDQVEAAEASAIAKAAAAAGDSAAAATARAAAQASAELAAGYAGAAAWAAATVYAKDAVVFSPVNRMLYRRKAAGASPGDPSADAANWDSVVLQVGGNAVWHAGNFNPAAKADLAGANFTALQVGGNAVWHAGNFNPVTKADLAAANFTVLSVGGKAVWHGGNFNPATKADLANANFTALSVGAKAVWHAGNFNPPDYLPLVGGAATGEISAPSLSTGVAGSPAGTRLYVNSPANQGAAIARFLKGGTDVASISAAGDGWFAGAMGIGGALSAPTVAASGFITVGSSATKLGQGDGSALRIVTPSGFVDIGSMNSSWAHIYTDRPAFYMNAGLNVQGALTQFGSAVWTAGNFDPATKAAVTSPTFFGSVSLEAGQGAGYQFWGSSLYSLAMGDTPEYRYGPVTGYSIKASMDSTAGRGWTWGVRGQAPVAGLSSAGVMAIAGSFSASRIAVAGFDTGVAGSVSASGWFRSSGDSGWFNHTFGGGIHMEDSTYVKVYGSKNFYCSMRLYGNGGGIGLGALTVSTGAPSGGNQGDIWVMY